MILRFLQLFVDFAYPASFSPNIRSAIICHLEDSYLEGRLTLISLYDVLISGLRERVSGEYKRLEYCLRFEPGIFSGIFLLLPCNLFLSLVFASLFLGGSGWLSFFRNFPYERNPSAEFFLPFLLFCASFLSIRDFFSKLLLLKRDRIVFKSYVIFLRLNLLWTVPFFIILKF